MRPRVIIIGSGAQGRIATEILEKTGHEIVGYLDDYAPPAIKKYGYYVLGPIEKLDGWRQDTHYVFIAIGDNDGRRKVWAAVHGKSYSYATAIHPSAVVMDPLNVGPGAMICAGAVVGANTMIGPFSIVNTNASIDHDSNLGEFAHLAPGAVTGGHVRIGMGTLVGINASIRDRVNIGENCIIGMGSVVLHDVPANMLAYGNPCVSVRTK